MATRVQFLKLGFGIDKEATYNDGSTTFLRVPKVNTAVISPTFATESNKNWVGLGSDFASQVFPVSADLQHTIQKYGGVEFMTWATAFAFGDVTESTGTYTIKPVAPGVLQLPSCSIVQQLPESDGSAIDQHYKGIVVDTLAINATFGAGLQSISTEVGIRGSGVLVSPSTVELPALTTEHHALSSGMTAMTINGVNYLTGKPAYSVNFNWSNALLADQGYSIGSGVDANGFATRCRLETGNREGTITFVTRMDKNSAELTKLRAITTGTAQLTYRFDSTHLLTFDFDAVAFKTVTYGENEGIVTVETTGEVLTGANIITCTAKCGVSGFAQAAEEED